MFHLNSLLDAAPPAMSKKIATARLAALREVLSTLAAKPKGDRHYMRKVIAEIAECRKIVGPPQFVPFEQRWGLGGIPR